MKEQQVRQASPKPNNQKACATQSCVITEADLPLCCPSRHQTVWNAHPRVYLPIEPQQTVQCPYCGTQYQWA